MKSFFVLALLLVASLTFAQKGDPYSNGRKNGCTLAKQINDEASFQNALNSITGNSAISIEYRAGYTEGMYACKNTSSKKKQKFSPQCRILGIYKTPCPGKDRDGDKL